MRREKLDGGVRVLGLGGMKKERKKKGQKGIPNFAAKRP
jgi:hypothetical protein